MKLATLKNNTRDGKLVVVSKDLKTAVAVPDIAPTLQKALEDWEKTKSQLQKIYEQLNKNEIKNTLNFDPHQAESPLPRAYQWADASSYVNHVELARKSRGVEMPTSFWTDPLIYQGGSDTFLGPCDDIPIANLEWGVDFEGEIAVITTDTKMGIPPQQAENNIALIMLVNDVSLRNLAITEMAKGFGFFQSKPSSSFSPVAVTLDELSDAWDGKKINLAISVYLNDQLFGQPHAGTDMVFDFPTLIAHAAKTRRLSAGTILGSGTISNKDRSVGSACIVERRMLEIINDGAAKTAYMQYGDRVRIEMFDKNKQSIFGAIDQKIVKY
jgi:fumarylacetoacetate (FAA) hydrolase